MRKYILIFLLLASPPVWGDPSTDAKSRILFNADQIRQSTGLNLIFEDVPPVEKPVQAFQKAELADYGRLSYYIQLFQQEIKKYPPDFFSRLKLRDVVFVKKLFYQDRPADGAYDAVHNRIYLDFLRSGGNRLSQQHNIHHELFHVIDVQSGEIWEKEDWNQLNSDGFKYSKEAEKNQNPLTDRLHIFDNPVKGFMTPYSQTSEKEDKAELFACLMMESQNKLLNRWSKDDLVLQSKISHLKNLLYQFCKGFDEEYWTNLFKK